MSEQGNNFTSWIKSHRFLFAAYCALGIFAVALLTTTILLLGFWTTLFILAFTVSAACVVLILWLAIFFEESLEVTPETSGLSSILIPPARKLRNWFKSLFLREKKERTNMKNITFNEGWKFGPVWFTVVRVVLSIGSGLVLASILAILIGLGVVDFGKYTFPVLLATIIIGALLIGWNDSSETVPEAAAAVLTFFGARRRIYRTEGYYPWTGKFLLLGRSKVEKDEGTAEGGFVWIKPFQIKIWNRSNTPDDIAIIAQARNNANIIGTLTLSATLRDAKRWISNESPVLALADRAREAFRGAIRHFVDDDCVALKYRIGRMMEGDSLLAVILPQMDPEKDGTNKSHSILQDQTGQLICITLSPAEYNDKVKLDEAEKTIRERAEASGSDYLDLCRAKASDGMRGEIIVSRFHVEQDIASLSSHLGLEINDAAVGDIQLSKPVTDAAEAASAEISARTGQLLSARTIADSTAIVGKAIQEHGATAAAIAAGADNNPAVKVVVTEGGNSLTDAASVHASVSGNGDKS